MRIFALLYVKMRIMVFGHSYSREISIWRWILAFVGGTFLFMFLYGLTQGVMAIDGHPWLKMALYIAGSGMMIFMYTLVVGKFESRRTDELSLHDAPSWTLRGLVVGMLYFVVVGALLAILGMYHVKGVDFDLTGMLEWLMLFLSVGVGEELVFRGIVFRLLAERWNVAVALVISSLIFGFVHLSNEDATVWSSIAIAIEAGLVLGAAYAVSGNLWFPIGIHWAWNYMQGVVLGFDVSGKPAECRLVDSYVTGPDIISGGAFGPEASVLSVVLGLSLSVWLIRKHLAAGKTAAA